MLLRLDKSESVVRRSLLYREVVTQAEPRFADETIK